ncbi:MAG: glutamate--tRNA ligase family protein, partial [Pseudomonadota bacterium]
MLAHDLARANAGVFLLRIEDIDQSRARPEWEARIFDDLHWLGLSWPEPVLRQSDNLAAYDAALDALWNRGLLYRCDCNRRDIEAAATAPQEGAALIGPDGMVYPGTCRGKHPRTGPRPRNAALRLDIEKALNTIHKELTFMDTTDHPRIRIVHPDTAITHIGDVVLARRDMGTSYHLSVVV